MQDSILILQSQAVSNRATNTRRQKSSGKTRAAQTDSSLGSSPDLPARQSSDASCGTVSEPDHVSEMLNDSFTLIEATETDVMSENTAGGSDGSAGANKLIRIGGVFSRVPREDVSIQNHDKPPSVGVDSDKNAQSVENRQANNVPGNASSLFVNHDTDTDRSYRDVAALSSGPTRSQPSGRPIETRLTRNDVDIDALASHVNGGWYDGEDENFEQYVKKRAKRFYLGGFKPTITRDVIANYVNIRGPTVTWVRIWTSKRNPNNVVIRLNVEDNYLAQLLESRSFWPRGVTCRPWRDRNDRVSNRRAALVNRDEITRTLYGRSDIDDFNPYSPLRDDANWD